jgi:glycosyltransferase involved in cell wall biosynthesis
MSGRIRILSVIDELGFGGDENRLLSLATTIDRDRFDHQVLTIARPDPARPESWAMHQHYAEAGVRPWSLGERPPATGTASSGLRHALEAGRRLLRKVTRLRRLLLDWRPAVVDAHLESAGLVSALAGAVTGTPIAVTIYSPAPREQPPLWWTLGPLILRRASVIVTDSAARRDDICRHMGRPADPRVRVIPNGITPPPTGRTRDEARAALGIPRDPRVRVIGQVAALARHKGHLHLLEAARMVLAREPSAVFLLVGFTKGDAAYQEQVEREARELGGSGQIRLLGYPGPIGDVWQAIDIQVHASTYDSLPNALIEGMSLAKPIVATTVGGVPDMLQDTESALLVPPGDGRALATALLRVLQEPGLAARLGQAAHRRYLAGYRAPIMTRRLEGCFAELAARPRRGARPVPAPQRSPS